VIRTVAAMLGQSPDRVRAWAYVRAVEDALWAAATGADDPARFVAVAAALARA
jgi:2-hydroxychromene-2-carboxylate isomerase